MLQKISFHPAAGFIPSPPPCMLGYDPKAGGGGLFIVPISACLDFQTLILDTGLRGSSTGLCISSVLSLGADCRWLPLPERSFSAVPDECFTLNEDLREKPR